jgi:hypothetical protein
LCAESGWTGSTVLYLGCFWLEHAVPENMWFVNGCLKMP